MPSPTFLPTQVVESIASELRRGEARALVTYNSANEEEDTMTGHVFGQLQTPTIRVPVVTDETTGIWTWSLRYTKFRGRGPRATESFVGADGIIELAVDFGGEGFVKSALFQAKMKSAGGTDLVAQCLKLSTWREAAFVVDYSPDQLTASVIDDVIRRGGHVAAERDRTDLATFLVSEFVGCKIGDRDLRYDAVTRKLYWRDMTGERVSADFQIKHRAKLTVKAPRRRRTAPFRSSKLISPTEIHLHRMRATPEEILGIDVTASATTAKRAQRTRAQIWHPDTLGDAGNIYSDLLNRRMAEINNAYDQFKKSKMGR